ncbi:MAG: sulfatase [Acidobacteriota bacterium]
MARSLIFPVTDFSTMPARSERSVSRGLSAWSLFFSILLGLSLAGCQRVDSASDRSAESPPDGLAAPRSVLILDIDTLRADRLGCYGNERATSPRIDALAERGVRFEWAFSQAPLTPPSQASILTGMYPSSHGVVGRGARLAREHLTLAEIFRRQGFQTAGFVDGGYMNRGFGMGQGFRLYADRRAGLEGIGPQVLDWLDDHGGEPFLLLVHTYDVHTPYDPPEPYRSLFLDEIAASTEGFEPTSAAMETVRRAVWWDAEARLPERDIAYALALYDAGIRYVDDWVGRIVDRLAALDLLESTLIVVISDHGEEFQEHGSVLHETLYSTVTRVPLILSFAPWGPSKVVSQTVETVDLMPTLLEVVDAPIPRPVQGESLAPLLAGRSMRERPAISESRLFGRQRAVALGDLRMIYHLRDSTTEVFEFRRDPLEQAPLEAADVRALRKALWEWRERVEELPPPDAAPSPIRKEVVDSLKALGYLQ